MESADMIVLDEFCSSHHVEVSFVRSLEEHGLIETIIVNETLCIQGDELSKLEQIVRLHRELNINSEGVDAIINLLKHIENMQNEITLLRNKLNFYEEHQ
ncbi:MAG: MerR family transcriptional regulator [Bacteroidetes bacterium]|nr:MAG: MerR family transcriptional regulator [Bacteroidota bacterium]